MFENGSFLRRRRRFKQESGNRHPQGGGGRVKGHRTSPNSISSNQLPDTRPNGTKSSRSRTELEKDSVSEDSESPKKVPAFHHSISHTGISHFRNMPVTIPIRKPNQLKPVNQVIMSPPILIHLHRCESQISLSSIL